MNKGSVRAVILPVPKSGVRVRGRGDHQVQVPVGMKQLCDSRGTTVSPVQAKHSPSLLQQPQPAVLELTSNRDTAAPSPPWELGQPSR